MGIAHRDGGTSPNTHWSSIQMSVAQVRRKDFFAAAVAQPETVAQGLAYKLVDWGREMSHPIPRITS
jgi:hypothetical protein